MTGREDLFNQAMSQGNSAVWEQMWDQAAAYYRQALSEFPDSPKALVNLGLALYELDQVDEALQCYIRAAKAQPGDPLPVEKAGQLYEKMGRPDFAVQAWLYAAEIYLKNRDVDKALENWTAVTRLQPENLQARGRLALVYEKTGNKAAAVSEYLVLAGLLQGRGELEKAAQAIQQALKLAPDHHEALQAQTLLRARKPLPRPARPAGLQPELFARQDQRRASPNRKSTQQLEGTNPIGEASQQALAFLAGLLFDSPEESPDSADTRRGIQSLVAGEGPSIRQGDHSRIILYASQSVDMQTRGETAQAAIELERAIEAGLDQAPAYFNLGNLYAQMGHLEKAVRCLHTAGKHAGYALGARLLAGECLAKLNRPREAAMEYLKALALADATQVPPEQADELRQLYESIIEAQRLQSDPEKLVQISENISALLVSSDWRAQLAAARQQLPDSLPGSPPHPVAEILIEASSSQVVESLAKIARFSRSGELSAAMEEAFYALEHAPMYLPLHTHIAELLLRQNQIQEAIAKFSVIARTYSTRGEADRAADIYRRIVQLAPMDLNARRSLIEHLTARGQVAAALQEYLALGDTYYNQADLEMARKTYTQALPLANQPGIDSKQRVAVLRRVADIHLQSLDWKQAMRVLEQIRMLLPEDLETRARLVGLNFRLNNEARALAEVDNTLAYLNGVNQTEKAIAFTEGILEENPRWFLLRSRLANLYQEDGRVEAAVAQWDIVGEKLLESGDRQGAIQALEAIVALNPPRRAEYQQVLGKLRSHA